MTVAALVAAVALVVVLGRRYQTLDTAYRDLREQAMNAHPGSYVPTYTAASLSGDTVMLGAPDPGTGQLLFFLNTTCPHCRATLPAWKAIADSIRRTGLPVHPLAVFLDSIGPTRAYASEQELTMPTVVMNGMRYIRLFRVGGVPLVMAVNDRSRVTYARRGRIETRAAVDSVLDAARSVMVEDSDGTAMQEQDRSERGYRRSTPGTVWRR